jgi:hypothetical protein
MALVFDRANIATAHEMTRKMEGVTPRKDHEAMWSQGVDMFEARESARYLVMIADGPARVMYCAPRICLADTDAGLHAALLAADEYLIGRRAMWVMKCEPIVEKCVRAILSELTIPVLPDVVH